MIVLDCRGHGRSTNPDGGYSFSGMAADIAGLVLGLGVERAHVVGHSNGGNVALMVALEHPEVVASCVIQAANAYVSPDLLDREPQLFDPNRITRDDPTWRDRMVRQHGRWHGREYWRELVTQTLAEILAAPNYTPADLASARTPVLVVEGRQDPVNAPAGHGEFIAAHIPDAELWRPEDVGHIVHDERPTEWLERVEDFWHRRGTNERDHLWRLKSGPFRDRRSTVFDVDLPSDADSRPRVTVLDAAQERAIDADLGASPAEVRVLRRHARRAIACVGVIDVRSEPADEAERLTQILFGEQVDLLESHGKWSRVQVVADGYVGWLRGGMVELVGVASEATHRVVSDVSVAFASRGGRAVSRLPMGAHLLVVGEIGEWLEVVGPAGRPMWVERASVLPIREPLSLNDALERFQHLVGVPYLWGGRTPWGFDCSGLTQAFMREVGIFVPRDADQQCAGRTPPHRQPQPGDLLFFSTMGSSANVIDHAAIALSNDAFLHASAAAGAVTINSLNRTSPVFAASLAHALSAVRRYRSGMRSRLAIGDPGATISGV